MSDPKGTPREALDRMGHRIRSLCNRYCSDGVDGIHLSECYEAIQDLATLRASLPAPAPQGAETELTDDARIRMLRDQVRAIGRAAEREGDALRAKVETLEAAHRKVDLALQSLTPGGSEYVNDHERCVEYVRDTLEQKHRILVEAIRARKAAEARLRSQGGEAGASQGPGSDGENKQKEQGATAQGPKPLAWTREKPTQPGQYWTRTEGNTHPECWEVVKVEFIGPGRILSYWDMASDDYLPIPERSEWAGPIPAPASHGSETPQEGGDRG